MSQISKKQKIQQDWVEKQIYLLSGQGSEKLWAYFEEKMLSKPIQLMIRQIRKKCKIPDNGIKTPNKFYTLPPKGITKSGGKYVISEAKNICNCLRLLPIDWSNTIEHYIYFNVLDRDLEIISDLCVTLGANDLLDDIKFVTKNTFIKDVLSLYPLSIHISPYATQRDVLDYIKKHWSEIKQFISSYSDKKTAIGKVRFKDEELKKEMN